MKNETFDEMAREVMRKIQRHDQHALGVIRAALRKAYALGEKDAEQSVQLTGGTLPDLQALFTPEVLSGLQADSTPPTSN
jgi:hypothetical protein